jgi:hypothetical protein
LLARQAAREVIAEVAVPESAGVEITSNTGGEINEQSTEAVRGPSAVFIDQGSSRVFSSKREDRETRIAAGQLVAHELGRQWRIEPDEIERFLATRSSWQRRFVP